MQLFLTAVGVVLSFAATGIYIVSIVRGKTKPHLFTYLVWSIVTIIAFFGSLVSGGGYGAWLTGLSGFFTVVVMVLCFRYGTKDIKPIDTFFLIAALISIVPWLIFKDPLWSVVLATAIDVCGYLPTIRKTWKAPQSEVAAGWALGTVRSAISLVTLGAFNITTVIFPLEILIMNSIVVYVIFWRRRVKTSQRK